MKNLINQKTLGFFVKTKGIFSQHLFGGIGVVFMLHRVLPPHLRNEWQFNKGLAITPEFLEKVILYLKSKGYQMVSLDTLQQQLNTSKKKHQKLICFTLDDGYRDNIIYGLPIFEKYDIPFTIYVTNSFPNETAHFWWYLLEKKILTDSSLVFDGETYLITTDEEKRKVYNLLRDKIKNKNLDQRSQTLNKWFGIDSTQIIEESKALGLSWKEIKEYTKHPLITIGAHTLNHLSLGHLSEKETEREITIGKEEMELKLECKINHFAYPYGGVEDVGEREIKLVRKAGFKTATLNQRGNIFIDHKNIPHQLPRYALGNGTTFEQLNYYLNGISNFAEKGWKRI